MKFRMTRKRRRSGVPDKARVAHERPPKVITVAATGASEPCYYQDTVGDELEAQRWALQKVFASQLVKISRKHYNDDSHNQQVTFCTSGDTTTVPDNAPSPGPPVPPERKADTVPDPGPPFPTERKSSTLQQHRPFGQLTCGAAESLLDSNQLTDEQPEEQILLAVDLGARVRSDDMGARVRSDLPCNAPQVVRISDLDDDDDDDDDDDNSDLLQGFSFPGCNLLGDWCPFTLPEAHHFNNRNLEMPLRNSSTLFLLTSIFTRKKGKTKRNGIPKVITVVIQPQKSKTATVLPNMDCCSCISLGPLSDSHVQKGHANPAEDDILLPNSTFDTSILRLEESLKKANLDADVEEKLGASPAGNHAHHHHHHHASDVDCFGTKGGQDQPTEDATTVTSSLSTHSSLKFGNSIVNLPSLMVMPAIK